MQKYILIMLSVAMLAQADELRLSAERTHPTDRYHLSHSKVVLQSYKYQQLGSLRRHDLSDQHKLGYEQAALNTNHYGFSLPLVVAGIKYKMSMDTGSSDVFIKGEKSPGKPNRKYKSGVNYKKSKKRFRIGYLDGELQTYQENLDVKFKNYTFKTPLLVAYTAPAQFQDVEGLIGLSFPSLAVHRPTFIETLIKNNIISKYAYGMNLNLIQQNRSFVSFGEKDPQLYEGEMHEYPITKSKEISIDFEWVQIGQSDKMQIDKALLDTGNTCISIPRQFQQKILNAFNTKNNKCKFMVEENVPMFSLLICKVGNFDELPQITLSIGGNPYVIGSSFYVQRCAQNVREFGSGVYFCDTYIESVKYRDNMIFLGDAFFNRFYTFFDLENTKVGIAKNKQNITMDYILKTQRYLYNPQDWQDLNSQSD